MLIQKLESGNWNDIAEVEGGIILCIYFIELRFGHDVSTKYRFVNNEYTEYWWRHIDGNYYLFLDESQKIDTSDIDPNSEQMIIRLKEKSGEGFLISFNKHKLD